MDPASRIIAQWQGVSDVISRELIVCGIWKRAVGKKLAQRTRALKLVRTTLVVEVEDELWKRNLWGLRYQILHNLAKAVGPEIVTDIELRIMPPRFGPQRAESAGFELSVDEADAIADPGLRRIYKAARRRETA
jgi:predicted nucleic acid-binding Zn ribbon protein